MLGALLREAGRSPSYIKALGSNYGAMVIAVIVQLIMVPVYISSLGTDGFGLLMMLMAVVDFVSIGIVWVGHGGLRIMGEHAASQDGAGFADSYSMTAMIYAGYGLLMALIFTLLLQLSSASLLPPLEHSGVLFLPLLLVAFPLFLLARFSFDCEQVTLAAAKRQWVGNLLQSLYQLLFLATALPLLLHGGGIHTVFFCMVGSLICMRLLAWLYWHRNSSAVIRARFHLLTDDKARLLLRRLIGDMGKGYAINGALVKAGQIDTLLVGWLGGPVAAGLYALIAKVPDFIIQLLWRVGTTAEPYFIHLDARGDSARLSRVYRLGLGWCIAGSLLLGLLFALLGEWVLTLWVGADSAPHGQLPYALAGMAAFWMAAVRWPASYAHALLRLKALNRVTLIETVAKLLLIVAMFDSVDYLAPFWAINIEFVLGVFALYLYLGRKKA